MASPKLTQERINLICDDIADGLSNKDACYVNDITDRIFYKWLATARESLDKPRSRLSAHQRLCIQLFQSLKKAKLKRKQKRIKTLQGLPNPTGLIFLLKNEYPDEFNKQPILIPNFQAIEKYMASEYTQAEIQAVREAILAAEERRQSEIEYDEDDAFTEHDDTQQTDETP